MLRKRLTLVLWGGRDDEKYLKIKELLEQSTRQFEVKYLWLDVSKKEKTLRTGIPIIDLQTVLKLGKDKTIDGVLLPVSSTNSRESDNSVYGKERILKENGFHGKIFVLPSMIERIPMQSLLMVDKKSILTLISKFSELYVAKFIIYEGCNINCAGCSHFASICKKPHMLSIDEFEKDYRRLIKIFKYVPHIQFLGGEPLMNPELGGMITMAKRINPYVILSIITNGLLLPKMDKAFFETLRENNVKVMVSYYKPLEKKIDEIEKCLKDNKIRYVLSPCIESFRIQYNLDGDKNSLDNYRKCKDYNCHTIVNGHIGGCYYAVTSKLANEYWGINIPEKYSYDLYSNRYSGAKLNRLLQTSSPLCSYCNTNDIPSNKYKSFEAEQSPNVKLIPWHSVSDGVSKDDWFTYS